jgi:FAD/FMN-containing dehydrogenase
VPQHGSTRQGIPLTVPFDLPSFTLNRLTIGAFNWLFYHKQLRADASTQLHFEPYLYPLDKVHHWNRIYGKRGFTQYQFAVPFAAGAEAIRECLRSCNDAGFGSFLSVLKAFGPQNEGLLSFPVEGLTLTLDLRISPPLFPILDRLDEIVVDHGGRVYLTKDVRLKRAMFDRVYPRADAFRSLRERLDPRRRIQSLQSRRLEI